jgi:GntR family transcriptional regulator
MFFSIDPNNGVAIYEQLVRQIKFAIADKTIRPGQLLPSARALSQQLAINPNTINRALQQLQGEGILELLRGRGMAVRDEATKLCIAARQALITDRFSAVISEALHAGLSSKDIRTIVNQRLGDLDGQVETISSQSADHPDATDS